MKYSKWVLLNLFSMANLRLVRSKNYAANMKELNNVQAQRFAETRNGFLFEFLEHVSCSEETLANIKYSKSQLYQDIFALEQLKWKRNGYFVEFGATDGVSLSNTYLMEKKYGWSGLLAEPGRNWHTQLEINRNCKISKACIWNKSEESVQFIESEFPEFSTIGRYKNYDGLQSSRKSKSIYTVNTVSLEDFLTKYNAPTYIDFISIDTEGSELKILSAFNFDRFQFGVMTVEHNHSINEASIDQLLEKNGYMRVYRTISQFDGWYIRQHTSRTN